MVVDRKIESEKYTAYVGGDNYEMGKAVGRYAATLLKGKGKVIEITGLKGSSPEIERHRGFADVLTSYPDIHITTQISGKWQSDLAEQKMDSLLTHQVKADLVYAQNDPMAKGAYRAALRHGEIPSLRIVGTDAIPGADGGLEAVKQGKLTATFSYPTGGDRAMQIAMAILQGNSYPRETKLTSALVNADNVEVMLMQSERIAQLDRKIEDLGGKFYDYLQRFANQQTLIYIALFALTLLIGIIVMLYTFFRIKNKKNLLLTKQKEQLESQKQQLELQKNTLEEQRDQLISQKSMLLSQKGQLEEQTEQLMRQTQRLIENERRLIENEKLLQDATQAKLVFFTNISHDFRTPLTLIEAPVEQLLADEKQSGNSRQLLQLIQKNTRILLRLVNQILDFRKIENGRMEIQFTPINLNEQFNSWAESFRIALLRRHISFDLQIAPDADYRLMADAEKMERIFFNLLSNASKYTPDGGSISVQLQADTERIHFSIFNSGSYLTPEESASVFERFYQAGNKRGGTGIGLALVRAFVEMHGGTINAVSSEQGTTFHVTLPKGTVTEDVRPDTVHTADAAHSALEAGKQVLETPDADLTSVDESVDKDAPSVLVIDDNPDIRSFLKMVLSRDYHVLTAANGQQGLKLALKFVPDVVVSDVMMPIMDGRECCRRLKSEMQTSHIPVILLTACSLEEQRIEGYDCGADSYISKPFSAQLLLSRIQNLINSRRQMKEVLGDTRLIERADISDLDKDFVTRFTSLVEERMGQSDLNVEDLGRELGMSRVQLYRKLKQLTNFSPVELLRQIRLRRAASLLVSTEMSVSEIGYEVGFTSPSYFTKCYKEEYGINPSEIVKKR